MGRWHSLWNNPFLFPLRSLSLVLFLSTLLYSHLSHSIRSTLSKYTSYILNIIYMICLAKTILEELEYMISFEANRKAVEAEII